MLERLDDDPLVGDEVLEVGFLVCFAKEAEESPPDLVEEDLVAEDANVPRKGEEGEGGELKAVSGEDVREDGDLLVEPLPLLLTTDAATTLTEEETELGAAGSELLPRDLLEDLGFGVVLTDGS